MLERLKDELFPILCIELILLVICVATNRSCVSKMQNVFICAIAYCAYTYSFVILYFIFITTILSVIVFLFKRHFIKVKPLKWRGCYSGKYSDLVKNNKIMDGCSVCALTFDEFVPMTQIVALKCRHAFTDDELIHKWLNLHRSCPTCRCKV
jgi:hypothetical protein